MSPSNRALTTLAPWRRTLTLLLAVSALAVTGALAGAGPAAAAPADVAADIPNLTTPVLVRQAGTIGLDDAFGRVVAVVARGYYGSVEVGRRSGDNYGPFVNLGRLRLIDPGVPTSLTILGDPAAVQTTAGIEVFVRGADNRIYTNTLTPSDQAVGYSAVPGLLASSDPEVLQLQDEPIGNIRLFVRGNDGAVWSNIRRAGSWEGWTSLGGFITSEIGVGRSPFFFFTEQRGVIQLVARGSDKRVYLATIRGANVTWEVVGGSFRATGNITSGGTTLGALFARGEDGRAWTISLAVRPSDGPLSEAQWTPIDGRVLEPGSEIAAAGNSIYVIGSGSVYMNRTNGGFGAPWLGYTELTGDAPGGRLVPGGNPVAFSTAPNENPMQFETLLLRETDSYLIKTTRARLGLPYSPYQIIGRLIDG